MNILIINGPNMNMLGKREPQIYGEKSYEQLVRYIGSFCLENKIDVSFFQSNHEGAIIDEIQRADGVFDGIVINPAGYSHTSVAIHDALKSVSVPAVEVHISDVSLREEFRRIDIVSYACINTVKGKGFDGYTEARELIERDIENEGRV